MENKMLSLFPSKIRVSDAGCHEWTAGRKGAGYGAVRYEGRDLYAHRLAWELANGPVPRGRWVLHSCDNPACTNPDHLFLGTRADNVSDMMFKDRHGPKKGANPSQEVAEMLKAWRAAGNLSQSVAAQMLDVNLRTYEGWEAGRGMPYPRMLALALQAFQ